MQQTSRTLHAGVTIATAILVLGLSLLATGHLIQSNWQELFLFNGDSLTLALYAQSLFSGEVRDWTFSSQIFFFPEILIYLICYALAPTLESSFIFNAVINFCLCVFLLYKIAAAAGANRSTRTGFSLIASALLFFYIALEQRAEVNVTALVTLVLFNTYYFGSILSALLIAWVTCRVLSDSRGQHRISYLVIGLCAAATYFSNPMFLLQGAIPFVLAIVGIRLLKLIEKSDAGGLVVAIIFGVVLGQLLRMIFSDHVGKSVGKYIHLRSFMDGLQGVGSNLVKVSASPLSTFEYTVIAVLLLVAVIVTSRYVISTMRDRTERPSTSPALAFITLFSTGAAVVTLLGTIISGNYLMRYFLPIAIFPIFVFLIIPLQASTRSWVQSKVYFSVAALSSLALVSAALFLTPTMASLSWRHGAQPSSAHAAIRCFNQAMTDKSFNVVGTFWTTRTLDAYRQSSARALQVNEHFEPTLWLNNRETYRDLKVNGVIVSRPVDGIRLKGAIYDEDTRLLGSPDRVFACADFDIYFYQDASSGFRYLSEQMKKLKR